MDLLNQVTNKAWAATVLARTGIIRPTRPDKLVRIAMAFAKWGPTPAMGYQAAAIRHPNETAIVDELGTQLRAGVDRLGDLPQETGERVARELGLARREELELLERKVAQLEHRLKLLERSGSK